MPCLPPPPRRLYIDRCITGVPKTRVRVTPRVRVRVRVGVRVRVRVGVRVRVRVEVRVRVILRVRDCNYKKKQGKYN